MIEPKTARKKDFSRKFLAFSHLVIVPHLFAGAFDLVLFVILHGRQPLLSSFIGAKPIKDFQQNSRVE